MNVLIFFRIPDTEPPLNIVLGKSDCETILSSSKAVPNFSILQVKIKREYLKGF